MNDSGDWLEAAAIIGGLAFVGFVLGETYTPADLVGIALLNLLIALVLRRR